MAKKVSPKISLEGLDDVSFDKEPDITSAQKIIEEEKEKEIVEKKEPVVEIEKKVVPKKKETIKPVAPKATKVQKDPRGTMPPANKKRASFNIDADLHRALKDYSYFNEIEMVEYIFENLVKPDLKKKGYYPPKKRK